MAKTVCKALVSVDAEDGYGPGIPQLHSKNLCGFRPLIVSKLAKACGPLIIWKNSGEAPSQRGQSWDSKQAGVLTSGQCWVNSISNAGYMSTCYAPGLVTVLAQRRHVCSLIHFSQGSAL